MVTILSAISMAKRFAKSDAIMKLIEKRGGRIKIDEVKKYKNSIEYLLGDNLIKETGSNEYELTDEGKNLVYFYKKFYKTPFGNLKL